MFDAEVLPRLDPTARALFGRVAQACRVRPCGHRSPRHRLLPFTHETKAQTSSKVRLMT
jgi:hypothetical protein